MNAKTTIQAIPNQLRHSELPPAPQPDEPMPSAEPIRHLKAQMTQSSQAIEKALAQKYERKEFIDLIFEDRASLMVPLPEPRFSTDQEALTYQLQAAAELAEAYRFERGYAPENKFALIDRAIQSEEDNIREIRGWKRMIIAGPNLMQGGSS